ATPTHSQDDISKIINGSTESCKSGRPCKKRRGPGRMPQNFDPVSQAIEDFEDEVMQGICRDLDLDNIESAS
uniref:Uncharacterized protein n=1 Tax=Meloidogyne javanica TaxID=6303 RepID=A0A915MMZ1_MELJA